MDHLTRKASAKILTKGGAIVILATILYSPFLGVHRAEAQVGDILGGAVGSAAGCAPALAVEKILKVKDEAEIIAKGAAASATGLVGGTQKVIDTANLSKNAATARKLSTEQLVNCVLNGLAWTAAKVAVQSMTQSMVNWINTGFDGSPAFVTDLERNLGNLADSVANDFLTELDRVTYNSTGFSIRAPFQDQIAAQLREEFYRTTSSYGFDVRHPYTLGNHSSDPAAFTRGDFSKGGFDALFSISEQANNPYGRYMLARQELASRLDSAAQSRVNEVIAGSGFLSWRGDCGQYARPQAKTDKIDLSSSSKEKNRNCPIRTPGALVENALGITATSPLRQLELADSVNEIVGALAGQLVNQVFGSGGLTGLSQPSSGGGRSFIDRSTDASQFYGGSALSGIATELQNASAIAKDVDAAERALVVSYDSAIQQCSRKPDIVSRLQSARATVQARIQARPQIIAAIETLRTRLNSLNTASNTQGTALTAFINDWKTLMSSSSFPTEGDVGAAENAREEVDALVRSSCT
jgi:hypothetical protein